MPPAQEGITVFQQCHPIIPRTPILPIGARGIFTRSALSDNQPLS